MNERIQDTNGGTGDRRPGASDSVQSDNAGTAWQVEIQTAGSVGWAGSGQRFRSMDAAQSYALDLQARWTAVSAFRLVRVPGEPTEGRAEAWADRGCPRPDDDAPAWRCQL